MKVYGFSLPPEIICNGNSRESVEITSEPDARFVETLILEFGIRSLS